MTGLADGIIKGISRLLVSVVPSISDSSTKASLINVLKLLTRHYSSSLLPLAAAFNQQAQQHVNIVHST